ncbi:helix-turn-helix transcriptional regulator [Lichenicoccus roseus]|nr:response regulator transcription factor [Lichenicoccus roseus]
MDASNLILIGRDIQRRSTFLQILQARHFEIALTCDDLSGLLAYDIETCPALCILVVDVEELAVQLDELAAARRLHPDIRIVIISQDLPQAVYRDVVRAGVNGIFRTNVSGDILGHSLRLILLGLRLLSARSMEAPSNPLRRRSTDLSPAAEAELAAIHLAGGDAASMAAGKSGATGKAGLVSSYDPSNMLSARELQVLHCLADGLSNKAIARNLDLAEATVKAYVKTLLRKIRVSNRTQAAIWAVNNRDAMKSPAVETEETVETYARNPSGDPENLEDPSLRPDYASMIRIVPPPIMSFGSRESGTVIHLHDSRHLPAKGRTGMAQAGRKTTQ